VSRDSVARAMFAIRRLADSIRASHQVREGP
jgi:hypothetical protein